MQPGHTLYLDAQTPVTQPRVRRHQQKVRLANGQVLAVYSADARADDHGLTYIYPQSFHARLTAFERTRADLFAATLGARVISVDQPGVGAYDTAISPSQASARRGNIRYHAIATAQAVAQAADIPAHSEVGFLGYSLGAWTVSSMIPAVASALSPLTWNIGPVILIDPSNLAPRPLPRLVAELFQDQRHAFSYVVDNENLGWKVPAPYFTHRSRLRQIAQRDSRQLKALLGPAMGMTRSTITDDFMRLEKQCEADYYSVQRTARMRTLVIRFDGSRLCPKSHIEHFMQGIDHTRFAATSTGLRVAYKSPHMPPAHSIMYSLPAVQQIAQHIKNFVAAS